MRLPIVAILMTILAAPTSAQSVLDQIEEKIGSRAAELARAEELLADSDPNRRIAAMEALLKSGDPAFVQKAKEVGLFSDDPRLRTAAIRAVLDAGGPMRAEFDIPTDESDLTQIYDWLSGFKGSWSQDRSTGHFGFVVGEYNEEKDCWLWLDSRKCVFRMSGEKVTTGDWRISTYTGAATMQLDDSGTLTGAFIVRGRGTPVTIRIPLVN